MTHAQEEVHEMIDDFKHYGMTETQAMFATLKIIQARYAEALVNAPMGSRPDYWGRAMDYFSKLVNGMDYETLHTSTR